MKYKPRIGVAMRLELETRRFYLGRDYSEALESCGASPLHLALIPKKEYIFETVKNLDGILLPGSDTDVDSYYYGEEPHPKIKRTITEKDETDLMVLEAAEKYKIPILGICFGMQILNVSRGGSLIQDIESQIENSVKHEQGTPLERNSHKISVKSESRLARLITIGESNIEVKVNSHHHQAIRNVGKKLTATAWANDGVIECIEDTRENRFVLGVQWHPELSYKFDDLSNNLFKSFVRECLEKRRK
jgi:putative glutamine amidotransferase